MAQYEISPTRAVVFLLVLSVHCQNNSNFPCYFLYKIKKYSAESLIVFPYNIIKHTGLRFCGFEYRYISKVLAKTKKIITNN